MTEIVLGYVPCKNKKEADRIAEALVEKRLIACANIIPSISSCYKFEGKMCKETESLLLMKTLKRKRAAVEKEIKKMHSYKLACIAFIEFDSMNKEYGLWVKKRSY